MAHLFFLKNEALKMESCCNWILIDLNSRIIEEENISVGVVEKNK